MKHRFISGIAAAAVLCGMIPAQSVYAADPLRGDADGSGDIGANDAQITLQAYTEVLAGNEDPLTDEQRAAADVDENGKIEAADAQFILTYYVYNNVSGKVTDWDSILHPMTEAEQARAAVQHFFDAYQNKDAAEILECSNYRAASHLFFAEQVQSDEELIADFEESYEPIASYEIGEGIRDDALLEKLNAKNKEMRESAAEARAERDDPNDLALLDLVVTLFEPVDVLYAFPTSITQGEKTVDDTYYALCRGGKWTADIGVTKLVFQMDTSRQKTVNASARTVSNAFNSALTDLDVRDAHVELLTGDHIFSGTDFEGLQKVTADQSSDRDTLIAALKYQVYTYMTAVGNTDRIAVHIENGVCTCTAISRKISGKMWYAGYASGKYVEREEPFTGIEEIFAAAKALSA